MPGAVLFLAASTALSNSAIVNSCSSSSRSLSDILEPNTCGWLAVSPKKALIDWSVTLSGTRL